MKAFILSILAFVCLAADDANLLDLPSIATPAGTEQVPVDSSGGKRLSAAALVGKTPFVANGATTARTPAARAIDVKNIYEYGATGDGETDDSAAFTAAVDALPATGGTLLIPDGIFKCGDVTISKPNVVVRGGGQFIDTTITVDGLVAQTVMNTRIHDVSFKFGTKTGGVHAVVIKRAWYVKVDHCDFDDPDACVYVPQIDSGQHTGRLFVEGNTVRDSNYLFFADRSSESATVLTTADCHVSNNVAVCEVCHVKGLGLDGVDIKGNTFFFPGYQTSNANKTSNIYLDRANWIVIHGNNLFEAGADSIYIARGQNFNITGNNIAWPGQRDLYSGIKIDASDVSGAGYSMGVITANNIQFPTKHGIDIAGICGYVSVYGNQIKSAGVDTYYYGTTQIGGISHYGVSVEATCNAVMVTGNLSPDNVNSVGDPTNKNIGFNNFNNGMTDEFVNFTTITGTETSVDMTGRSNRLNTAQGGASSIASFGNPPYYKHISVYSFNSNTTLVHGDNIKLKGGVNATLPAYGSMSFDYVAGQWFEMSRNF